MTPNSEQVSFGDLLVRAREAMGLTRSQAATHLGLRRITLYTWEVGRHVPGQQSTIDLLPIIARKLKLKPSELMEAWERSRAATEPVGRPVTNVAQSYVDDFNEELAGGLTALYARLAYRWGVSSQHARQRVVRLAARGLVDMPETTRDPNQCVHGHPFTEKNTYTHNGKRSCRTCKREQVAAFRKRQAA